MKKGKIGELLRWLPLVGMIVVVLVARFNMRPRSFDQLDGARTSQERESYYVWINGWDKGKHYESKGYIPKPYVAPLLRDLERITYRKVENQPTYSLSDGGYYNFCIEWYIGEDPLESYTLTLTRGGYLRLDWGERWYRMDLSRDEIEVFMKYYKNLLSQGFTR
ncbi:MAG: hypothetical protein ACRCW2_14235 [Cellulosilyticaceae bacterium]